MVPVDELDAATHEVVDAIAGGPPVALSLTKRELDNASASSLAQALEAEAPAQSVNVQTDDMREALVAVHGAPPADVHGTVTVTDMGFDGSESWDGVLDDLEERRAASRAMGGEERLAKHRAAGKLDARARIDHLLDPGSFLELGTLVGGDGARPTPS